MNTETNPLMSQWIIPILGNIIAAIIIYFAVQAGNFGKKILSKDNIKSKLKAKLNSSNKSAVIKYLLFTFIGIFPVGYNIWWFYQYVFDTSPVTRIEVIYIFIVLLLTIYWIWNIFSKFKKYSLSDFSD